MARADASEIGENAQEKVIANWVEKLWIPLAKVLAEDEPGGSVSAHALKQMQVNTIPILVKLDPDYVPPSTFQDEPKGAFPAIYVVGVAIALLALLVATVLRASD